MGWNVFVTRKIPQAGIDALQRYCEIVDVNPEDRVLTKDELCAQVRGRDGVLCLLTDKIDDEVLQATGSRCKVFANYAVGYDNIDIESARKLGIRVTNTPGVLTDATSDHAWALLFAAARRIVESDAFMRSGQWTGWGPLQFIGQDITGRTLGVIGAGRIGVNFALKSIGFQMKVVYADVVENKILNEKLNARRVTLEELLGISDFISLHIPLMPQTKHIIGEKQFGLMKPTAVLINTSRGPIVDEQALMKALQTKKIAAAGLDVYENEPKPVEGLLKLPNVVVCPHIASATLGTRTKMAIMAAENLIAVLQGKEPPNAVV